MCVCVCVYIYVYIYFYMYKRFIMNSEHYLIILQNLVPN